MAFEKLGKRIKNTGKLLGLGTVGAITLMTLSDHPEEAAHSTRKVVGTEVNVGTTAWNKLWEFVSGLDLNLNVDVSVDNAAPSSPESGGVVPTPGSGNESVTPDESKIYISPGGLACSAVFAEITAVNGDGPITIAERANVPSPQSYRAIGGKTIDPKDVVVVC